MGIAMAGMFVTHWAFWPAWFWETAFFALTVWFVVRSVQSVQQYGVHVPHEGIHAVMSLAMILMYLYPMGATGAAMSMTGSSPSSHGILDPGLGLLLAVTFFGSAIFTLGSSHKGSSHHGTHRRHRLCLCDRWCPCVYWSGTGRLDHRCPSWLWDPHHAGPRRPQPRGDVHWHGVYAHPDALTG